MAQAMASVAGLSSSSHTVMEGSMQISRLSGGRVAVSRPAFATIRAQQQPAETEAVAQSSRRAILGLVAAGMASGSFVKEVLADVKTIKVGPAPPPSGGLPGTLNADQPRDLDLPLKDRFFIQPLPPTEAVKRAKESAQDILNVKALIDKKQWPYVKNDLRLKASYLRYDLNTVIAAKPKEEKKALKELASTLFSKLDDLDHAAKIKSTPEAEKYYAEAKSALGDVLAKLG